MNARCVIGVGDFPIVWRKTWSVLALCRVANEARQAAQKGRDA